MKTKLLIITAMLGISTLASCSPTGTNVNPVNRSENPISEVSSSSSNQESSSEELSEEEINSSSSGENSSEASSEEEIINYSKDINDYYGGYYSSLSSWTNGEDLKNQLHALISKNIKKQKYSGNWEVNTVADVSQYNFDMLDQVYSSKDIPTYFTAGYGTGGWNREHAFCQSLMGHYVSSYSVTAKTKNPKKIKLNSIYQLSSVSIRGTRFYAIYKNGFEGYCDGFENDSEIVYTNKENVYVYTKSSKASKNLGALSSLEISYSSPVITFKVDSNTKEFTPTTVDYNYSSEGNGGVASDFHNLFASEMTGNTSRGNLNFGEAGDATTNYVKGDKNFEPADEDKGRLARAILYMDTCYDDLSIQEEYAEMDQVTATNKGAFGNASTIISWADSFDVNYQEYQHTQRVYEYQTNRNPYVDFPELIDYVYGNKKDNAGTIQDILKSSTQNKLHTAEKNYKNFAFSNATYEYQVGDKFTTSTLKLFDTYTDLSKEEVTDRSEFNFSIPENYEFTASDIGTKTVTITRGEETYSYSIEVKEYDASQNYEYQYTADKNDFTIDAKSCTLNGVKFNLTYDNFEYVSSDKTKGVQIGKSTNLTKKFTLESESDFAFDNKNKITNVRFSGTPGSGTTINVSIYVGDTLVSTKALNYDKDNLVQNLDFALSTPSSGKLKIVIDNNTDKAFYIHDISVDLVD